MFSGRLLSAYAPCCMLPSLGSVREVPSVTQNHSPSCPEQDNKLLWPWIHLWFEAPCVLSMTINCLDASPYPGTRPPCDVAPSASDALFHSSRPSSSRVSTGSSPPLVVQHHLLLGVSHHDVPVVPHDLLHLAFHGPSGCWTTAHLSYWAVTSV